MAVQIIAMGSRKLTLQPSGQHRSIVSYIWSCPKARTMSS